MIDESYKAALRSCMMGNPIRTRNATVRRACGLAIDVAMTPLVGIRRTAWKSALREMEWFLSGSNAIADLHPSVQKWWRPWVDANGLIPHNYSRQFRAFGGDFDQIEYLVESLRDHPHSRRACATTWNARDMAAPDCPITNCHGSFIQCFVNESNCVDMMMFQRSADMVCGVPHNWIQYWAFLMWLASRSGRGVGRFRWIGGDCHVYEEHEGIVADMLNADVRGTPSLVYSPSGTAFRADDFALDGEYRPTLEVSAGMVV